MPMGPTGARFGNGTMLFVYRLAKTGGDTRLVYIRLRLVQIRFSDRLICTKGTASAVP